MKKISLTLVAALILTECNLPAQQSQTTQPSQSHFDESATLTFAENRPTSVAAASSNGTDQAPSADEVNDRLVRSRAVEAVIWGMPIVNFDRMVRAVIQNGGAVNQIVYWSQPVNWQDQTLTPNPDTIYFNPFYDTRNGPVVLEIPAAEASAVIVGTVDNAWQNALEDVGPAGADKGKSGKYLITPPDYKDKAPDGYILLPSDTFQGFVVLRSNFKSHSPADIAAAVAYGKRIKLYPLSARTWSPSSTPTSGPSMEARPTICTYRPRFLPRTFGQQSSTTRRHARCSRPTKSFLTSAARKKVSSSIRTPQSMFTLPRSRPQVTKPTGSRPGQARVPLTITEWL